MATRDGGHPSASMPILWATTQQQEKRGVLDAQPLIEVSDPRCLSVGKTWEKFACLL